jgi:hypothetical protein
MVVQLNTVWHMPNHQYHERLDTHCMVLEHRADTERGDTMIYTMEK